jgi:hypothetical protein
MVSISGDSISYGRPAFADSTDNKNFALSPSGSNCLAKSSAVFPR